ncbi:MAG: hypothetical protein KF883_00100 [Thermomicrobiales bacterium]|nr:hypothetical protein [Thermomicrobiales bacterium]
MTNRITTPDRELLTAAGFSDRYFPDQTLRAYQTAPAQAILESVRHQRGEQHAVVFSRQAGKDELLAQLVIQLLVEHRKTGGTIVLAAPTFRPQSLTMRDRVLERLRFAARPIAFKAREGMILEVGRASARFLSASPLANTRGQTASLLLVANEAQDIDPDQWDAVFDPMAVTTNATTLFMGTVWSRHTLLARQMRYLDQLQDVAKGRVWKVDWTVVAQVLEPYGERVRNRIAQQGRDHPTIRTEFFLEELDDAGSLFTESHIARMQGDHPRQYAATPGHRYALLVDVAGESETPLLPGAADLTSRRDSTALTVVEIVDPPRERGGFDHFGLQCTYRVVDRKAWTGVSHRSLHQELVDLARRTWKASVMIVDATGVGAGLASFLKAELSRRVGGYAPVDVVPFHFTAQSKSRLAWDFLGLIGSGRYQEYADIAHPGSPEAALTAAFSAQLRSIEYDVANATSKQVRWGTPAHRGHDDLVMSAAMTALLDDYDYRPRIARGS